VFNGALALLRLLIWWFAATPAPGPAPPREAAPAPETGVRFELVPHGAGGLAGQDAAQAEVPDQGVAPEQPGADHTSASPHPP